MSDEEVTPYEVWEEHFLRGGYFQKWAEIVYHELLKDDPTQTPAAEIESGLQGRFPELCDDRIICPHTGGNVPEWKHQVRNILSRLGKRGLARAVGRGQWVRFENYDGISLVG